MTSNFIQLNIIGYNAYIQFNLCVTLKKLTRQTFYNDPDQNKFFELLPRLRNGDSTIDE